MSKSRLQGPENFGGFTHNGQSYEADEDGVVEVPVYISSEVLTAHGLKPAEAAKGPKKLEPLAKASKEGEADDEAKKTDELKPAQKGAKLAKGGEQ